MDREQFRTIVDKYRKLDRKQMKLRAEQSSKLYNTPGNSHHPLAFSNVDDALHHRQLERKITEIENDKRRLAFETQHEGFPEDRWIKIEGPEVCDNDATGIMLREYEDGHCELKTEDWTLVLAEG